MANREGQSLLREIHRQSCLELLLRPRHHRPGGRHPRLESAQQPGAARRADQGFRRSRVRPAPADAHHRQLAGLPVQHRDQRVECRTTPTTSRTPFPAALERRSPDGCVSRSPRGVRPVFPEAPPETRAEQVTDPHIGKDGFLDLFGRPSRESSCECERRSDLSLPQALNLVNGKTISDAVADSNGRIAKAILSGRPDAIVICRRSLFGHGQPPADSLRARKGVKYLQVGRRAGRACARSAVGAGQQQSIFVQPLTGRNIRHASHSRPPMLHLRRTDAPRTVARRIHRNLRAQPRELSRLQKTAKAATKYDGARGFGAAKSVIMIFLQGGPSHIDIWDPKPDAPANIRGEFQSPSRPRFPAPTSASTCR